MGIHHTLSDGVLSFVTTGDVDFTDGLERLRAGFAAAAAADPARKWGLLFDIRHLTEDRSSGDIRGIAAKVAAERRILSGKCAVVVASPVYYGLGRMFGAFVEPAGLAVQVFHDPAAAEAWLREPPEARR